MPTEKKAVLLLEDGTIFSGYAFGADTTTAGELCFNTSMTGYQEVFTDPSYYGQIIVATHTHIGNYGTLPAEAESKGPQITALVCRNFSFRYSRVQAEQSLDDYFKAHGVPGIGGIDTRALVRHIRSKGAMNAVISTETTDIDTLKHRLAQQPDMSGLELATKVSTAKTVPNTAIPTDRPSMITMPHNRPTTLRAMT